MTGTRRDDGARSGAPVTERWGWLAMLLAVHRRFGEINGNWLAAGVTLTVFLSLFPLVLVAIAAVGFFAAGTEDLAERLVRDLGLTGQAAETLVEAVQAAEETRRTASIVGFLGLLWSGLGVVAAIQAVYNQAWQVRGRGMRDKLTGLLWLGGAAVLFLGSFALTASLGFLPGLLAPIHLVVGLAVGVALFTWTGTTLCNRPLPWRTFVAGAVVAAVGFEILKVVGGIYVPRAVAQSSAMYGSLGVVFAVLAWLMIFARLLVYAALTDVVRWERSHGTVTVEVEVPRVAGDVPVDATRAGQTAVPEAADASG